MIWPPLAICFATRSAVSGARLSRLGPTFPFVPASLSVWQPPQVAVNAVLPAARSAPELPPVVVAVLPDSAVVGVSPVVGGLGFVPTEPPAGDRVTGLAVVASPSVISSAIVAPACLDQKQAV